MRRKLTGFLAIAMAVMVAMTSTLPTNVLAAVISDGNIQNDIVSGNDIVSENSMKENEENIDGFGEKGKLNYLYLESNYIETPSAQNIMVSFGDESTVITKATLVVENYKTKEKSYFISEECMDNMVLFEMNLTAEDAGIYEAIAVSVTTEDGKTKYVQFSKTGMENVYYGVDEEVVLTEEEPISEAEAAIVETQIVTFEEGYIEDTSETEISTALEEALDEAETHVEDGTLDMVAPLSAVSPANIGTVGATEVDANRAADNLIVVIDPGHDESHAGARANGLEEENLTLKIAQYCKEELEKYAGVTVYMTRTAGNCPYPGTSSTVCNKNRVNYAQSVGADVYVSIHLNSATNTTAKGAEVFYPNSNYNCSIGATGANLAKDISRQLAALGLNNRGINIRNSEDNSLYPDGSLADYYGVIKNSKLAGFPAVIIEHAFLTNASDAAFLSNEANLKKLGIADATGIAEYYGLSEAYNFTSNAPTVTATNNATGKFTASITGVTPLGTVSKVKFGVWNEADGQDDLTWYYADNKGNGTFTREISITNHGAKAGTYQIHVYVVDIKGKSHFMGATTCTIKEVKASLSTVNTVVASDEKSVTITATGVANADEIQFAVWSGINGQDDLKWYTAKNNGNGSWSANVKIADHKASAGEYQVHVYAKNVYNSAQTLKSATFRIEGPAAGKVEFKNTDVGKGTFTVEVTGAKSKAGIAEVKLAVWSKADQSNLKWYTAARQSDGSYAVNVNIANHGYEYGIYQAHAYVKDNNGISAFTAGSVEMKQPKVVVTAIGNANQTQYNVKASNVTYIGGVKGVKFAVWSTEGGQNDLIWYQAERQSNGTWSINVPVSNHKTAGSYSAHMYIIDKNGNSHFGGNTSFNVDRPIAGKVTISDANSEKGTFKVNIAGMSAKSGIAEVQVAVWSKSDQSNLRWYIAKKQSDGSYFINVNLTNHCYEYGIYQAHAYVKDNNGIMVVAGSTVKMEQPKAVITASGNANQMQYNVKAANVAYVGGVKGVKFAVWSIEGGQDDLIWYQAGNQGNGVWSINVPISSHKTAGKYEAHIYVIDKNGNSHFCGNASFSVTKPTASSVAVVNKQESDGTFGVKVSGVSSVSGVKEVKVAVWCAANQSDMIWYTASNTGTGIYEIVADVRNHNSNLGNYNAHVYVTAANGVKTFVGYTNCSILDVDNLLYPIMGSTSVSVDQMVAYYNSVTTYPSYYANTEAATIRQFCQIYIEECNKEGVKAEVAFVQAMKETNFLRYGGDVNISQFNFAGIGATGGVPGNSFASVRIGIRAHVQHLKAYASSEALTQECVDPRFKYVTRNTAPYCEWLGIKENPYGKGWASAVNYGYNVVERIKNLKKY